MTDDTKRHWDRDQWAEDDGKRDPKEPQAETWQRGQVRPDLEGDAELTAPTEPDRAGAADAGDLSGRGQPSGESHFDRTEEA